MHRRVWFLVVATAAVLALAGSAAASRTAVASSSALARSNAAFQKAFPDAPRTPAARAAKNTAIFGLEQTVSGFNLGNLSQNAYYAAIVAGTPVIRGNYLIDDHGIYHLDMASKVIANKNYLRIYIKKNANWYWVGHKKLIPVTAADYVYTWKQTINPHNNVAGNTGLINMDKYKINNKKEVTFYWRKTGCTDAKPCGAFVDYRDLFGYIYPSFALKGENFNHYWTHCVCGNDGNPISDGPYYLSHYIPGSGMELHANTHWYGSKAKLSTVYFRIITDTNSEIQAMKGGEVDAISPSPEAALAPLAKQKNLTYSAVPSFTQEHWDIQAGPSGLNPLNNALWMRQAIAEGLNRQGLINALYPGVAPGLKPLNNPFYEIGTPATGANAYFAKFNYNPTQALSILSSHCSGGPSNTNNQDPSKIWTCNGHKAEFKWYSTNRASRVTSGQIFKQELLNIGIQLDVQNQDPATFFGGTLPGTSGTNGVWDLAEYAWIGGPDPSGFDSIYLTGGGSNYKNYSNPQVDALIHKGDAEFNAAKRTADYEAAAKLISNDIGIIPLYASPQIFVHKKALLGSSNNPTSFGPTWNIEKWHW